jgi:hypothetical protein
MRQRDERPAKQCAEACSVLPYQWTPVASAIAVRPNAVETTEIADNSVAMALGQSADKSPTEDRAKPAA